MIKGLTEMKIDEEFEERKLIVDKINEIVEAVNRLENDLGKIDKWIHKSGVLGYTVDEEGVIRPNPEETNKGETDE